MRTTGVRTRGAARAERARPRPGWATAALALALAVAWAALIAGCAGPEPLAVPTPVNLRMDRNVVLWTTETGAYAAVRWGRRSGQYGFVSYPPAAGRADRALALDHRVPLLSVAAGDTVYFQTIATSVSGIRAVGFEERAVIDRLATTVPAFSWTMIDVGFGDSHLLTMPQGARVLVDGGERRDAANVLRFLSEQGVTSLDAVVVTHLHLDHLGGMVGESGVDGDGVIEAVPVGVLLEGANPSGNLWQSQELAAAAVAHGIARGVLRVGDTDATQPLLRWDPAVRVEVLNAGSGHAIGGESDGDWINNDSIVLRVRFGDVDLLLGGDAEAPVQERWRQLGTGLESEVLKVHHHGVADASEPTYLDAVRPRVGLIPIATYESYDGTLPSGIVLGRLHDRVVDVYASDRAEPLDLAPVGAAGYHVTVVTDGASYELRVEPSRSVHYPGDAPAATMTQAPVSAWPRRRTP